MSCDPRVVVVRPKPSVVVQRNGARTVVTPAPGSSVIVPCPAPDVTPIVQSPEVEVTQPLVRVVDVVQVGRQGPKGEPGGSIPAIPFSFGDAPGVVWTPDTAGLLTYVRLIVKEAFDQPSTIEVGTLADPDVLLPAMYNAPTQAAEYEYTPDVRLVAGESVYLTISPGLGATTGSGLLLLEFLPD